jgi:antimicrobial peptide system SdpB family protein
MVDGGDQVSVVLTLLLLPVTETDSRKWHCQNSHQQAPHWRTLVALLALIAVRVQVAGIYLHAALGKLGVQEWVDGTALYYWFIHPDFGAVRPLWYLLEPLLRHGPILALMTWSVIIFELSLFMALVMPKRVWGYFLVAGLLFHGGIAAIHGLISFSLAMAGALVLYLRPIERPFQFDHLLERLMPHRVASAEQYHSP